MSNTEYYRWFSSSSCILSSFSSRSGHTSSSGMGSTSCRVETNNLTTTTTTPRTRWFYIRIPGMRDGGSENSILLALTRRTRKCRRISPATKTRRMMWRSQAPRALQRWKNRRMMARRLFWLPRLKLSRLLSTRMVVTPENHKRTLWSMRAS